ncbi:MAG: hypothetical protein RIS38_743 [Verrucomicrobiota bacterium]
MPWEEPVMRAVEGMLRQSGGLSGFGVEGGAKVQIGAELLCKSAKVRGSSFQVAGGSLGWQVAGDAGLKGEPETGANERLGGPEA